MTTDTIVAQSTATGRAALAIVRLTGPDALAIVAKVFRPRERLASLATHCCAVGFLVEGDEPIDQVVVTVFRAPDTYTGEDLVEITCHGGLAIPGALTRLLQGAGARAARPGEFTQRAFLHGRIDLSQAEAVAELINARSAAAAQMAMRMLAGGLRRALDPSLRRLTHGLALLEATLDIQEDGSPDVLASADDPTLSSAGETAAVSRARLLESEAQYLGRLLDGARGARLLEEGIRVAIVGLPNAGKSSIFNALLSRERAIVSPEPGTTRDFLEGWVEWSDLPIILVDTAGLQAPGAPLEAEAMRRTWEAVASAAVILFVVDVGVTTPREAAGVAGQLSPEGCDVIHALHKWDRGASAQWRARLPRGETSEIRTALPSSVCGPPGVEGLRAAITARARARAGDLAATLSLGDRQFGLLTAAREALTRACALAAGSAGDEMVAFELRAAADALGQILGRRVGPEVLDEIFSRFCVGK